jgi:hypothetical protein
MKQTDHVRTAVRHAKREKRLGPDAVCLLCGESHLEALTPVTKGWLERHHVGGKANDATLTATLCLNCHRKVTEGLEVAGVSMGEPRDIPERLVMILRALAEFFCLLANALREWARQLESFIGAEVGPDRPLVPDARS